MTSIIADTNFLLGLVDSKDKWHQRSTELYQSLKVTHAKMIIFDCVANELISVIGKRFEESGRQERFKGFIEEKLMPLISKDNVVSLYKRVNEWYDRIIKLIVDSSGKLNFHDALIQIGAKEMDLQYIISFEEDFDEATNLIRIKEKRETEKFVF
ncbi:PIN domain-containing protein [Candidatus Aerophobetes bacterium]|nr:PIN domain-containing protein [Candidatus Aerophobetes bacterium]